MSIQFRTSEGEATALGSVLLAWWQWLVEEDRAGRAILRRASSPTQVAFSAPYQRLYRRLLAAGWPADARPQQNERLAGIVGLLAHIKKNEPGLVAAAMSWHGEGDRPPVSELRFLRLLDAPDGEALYTGIRRVLPLMNHQIDVLALADDFLYWGDAVKKRWAYSYHWPDKAAA